MISQKNGIKITPSVTSGKGEESGEPTAISKSPVLLHLGHWLVGAPNMRLTTAFLYVQ